MNNTNLDFSEIPVVVLCGGRSVTMGGDGSAPTNKALVHVLQRPLFWWVLRHYVRFVAHQFVLATGFQSERFADVLTDLGSREIGGEASYFSLQIDGINCEVRLVPTAPLANTAARLLACKPWVDMSSRFAVTYSDTVSDVNLEAELALHIAEGRVATLVSAKLPVRFRILGIRNGETAVRAFATRPVIESVSVNGGYYLFTQAIWQIEFGLAQADALENHPLEQLAKSGQLIAFPHTGIWQNCDSERDFECIEHIVKDWL